MENTEKDLLKKEIYHLHEITEATALLIDKNGNKSRNPEGPLDSMEEWYFTCYLKELKEAGVIEFAYKNEVPIVLSKPVHHVFTQKMKTMDKSGQTKHLLNDHVYTPDFTIQWIPKWVNLFYDRFNQGVEKKGHKIPFLTTPGVEDISIIEIKANFTQADKLTEVSNNIKWTFEKFNMFVQKVNVPKIFEQTFTPKAYMDDMVYKRPNSKKNIKAGDSRLKFKPLTLEQYLEKIKLLGSFQKEII